MRRREVPGPCPGTKPANDAGRARGAPGLAERRAHDYWRHGTTSLFAALEVATGKVTDQYHAKRTNKEFLTFLKHMAKTYPDGDLHIVVDNYRTHKHANVTTGWPSRGTSASVVVKSN